MPNKHMQPFGSGLYVWLQQEMIARLGNEQAQEIIAEAALYGQHRYGWMLSQMTERGYPDLAEAFLVRKRAEAHERFMRDKLRTLEKLREQAVTTSSPLYADHLRKRIARIEKYLADKGAQA